MNSTRKATKNMKQIRRKYVCVCSSTPRAHLARTPRARPSRTSPTPRPHIAHTSRTTRPHLAQTSRAPRPRSSRAPLAGLARVSAHAHHSVAPLPADGHCPLALRAQFRIRRGECPWHGYRASTKSIPKVHTKRHTRSGDPHIHTPTPPPDVSSSGLDYRVGWSSCSAPRFASSLASLSSMTAIV